MLIDKDPYPDAKKHPIINAIKELVSLPIDGCDTEDWCCPNCKTPYHIKNIEGVSYQFRRSGQSFWEDMAEKNEWAFLEQFLPDYYRRDDVAFSDDLSCVIEGGHDYKDLEWLHREYPEYDGFTIEDVERVLRDWDSELFKDAENNLQEMVQMRLIEVREFPTSIVSARVFEDGNDDYVVLQCADANSYMFRQQFKVLSSKLQNVRTRDLPDYDPEVNDDWQIQIYYKGSGGSYWCNAMNIDFE